MTGRPARAAAWLLATALLALAGLVGAAPAAAGPVAPAVAAQPVPYEPHEQLAPLRAEHAWRHSTGEGVVVAVLDSGIDADHHDFSGRVLPGQDYVDGSTDGRVDLVGHGTTVASLVAGGGDPAIGLAPDATILPVRVLDEQNRYQNASTVADGVVWAVDQGADVINMSLGGPRDSEALSEALGYAMAHDVVVIACTGNATGDDYQQVWYPAREPGVVAVSGMTYSGATPVHWSHSLTGPETVLAAPAVVTGAQAGGGHREVQGTSFSAALVAGSAALIRARWPELPAAEVVNRLVATAEELGADGRNATFGFGAVDPVAALTEPVPEVHANPLDTKARSRATGLGVAPDREAEHAVPPPAAPPPEDTAAQPAGGAADEPAAGGPDGSPSGPAFVLLGALTALLVAAATIRFRRHS